MESQKNIQVAAAVSQMMRLIQQDELALNYSNLMDKYSYSNMDEGQGVSVDYNDSGGNYSGNSSILLDPDGTDITPSEDYVPYSLRPETYIIPIVFAMIFCVGVIGNGTLIAIFLKHRSMRNIPNTYICSLAVGDILVIFFCVPFTSTVYTVESWPYGVVVCKFSEFIKDLSIGVSVFTLTALSADRYLAIVNPMRKVTGGRASKITFITITGIWLVSIIFALPSLIFSFVWTVPVEGTNKTFDVCYPFPKELTDAYAYPKVVVMFKFLVYYAIPLGFIATFYIIMAHSLLQSARNMPGEAQGQQVKQIQSRKKVAKMVLSFVVIFAICFFPSHVFLIWFYYYPNAEEYYNLFWHWVRMVGFCLSFINSCINPITLYCVSGTFRKHFNRYLFCCCLEHRDHRHLLLRHHHNYNHNNHFIRAQPHHHVGGGGEGMSHSMQKRDRTNGAIHISRLTKSTRQANGIPLECGERKCENEFEMTTRKREKLSSIPEVVRNTNSNANRVGQEGDGVGERAGFEAGDGGSNGYKTGDGVIYNHRVASSSI